MRHMTRYRTPSPRSSRRAAPVGWLPMVMCATPHGLLGAGSVASVELAGPTERELDAESADWLRRLSAGAGGLRQQAERELHARLVRIALAEVNRRSASTPVTGPELTDVAHQAAGDAMLAILAKLADFRGESRFITWAYRFVILEVSSKLGRHYWRNPRGALDAAQWERLPDRLGIDPEEYAASACTPSHGHHGCW